MKIAVLTWFRDMNYGTVLQALALQMYLKEQGHDPELINFLPERNSTINNRLTFLERLNRKADFLCNNKFKKDHADIFQNKLNKFYSTIDENCSVSKPIVEGDDFETLGKVYDLYICGSDQIWNPYWFEPHFFLDFVAKEKTKIAYAPSLGISNVPKEFHDLFRKYLSSFDGISLREAKMASQLSDIVGREIINVCDPVFLLDRKIWTSMGGRKTVDKQPLYFLLFFVI